LLRELFSNVLLALAAYAMVASASVSVVEGALWFIGLRVQLPAPNRGNAFDQPLRDKN
jgi:ABC-type dipeptide/oligopeptide/nickel transport system permease subunit